MPRFLIDANLPYRFSLWHGPDYVHVYDLGDDWTDSEIWRYAREHQLAIVTKDADFSDRALLSEPPPRVVHLRIGNMRLKTLFGFLTGVWPEVEQMLRAHKLVLVYPNRLEGLG
ncbi:MAG: DUF5615 family PIN-like protein [Pseudomonadota bacterium]|nr:DUF5615 family PIN-like protein [Pseudomonadota bacterium]